MDSADVMIPGQGRKVLKPLPGGFVTKPKKKVSKGYNDRAARWVEETISKMDDDEAQFFATVVVSDVLNRHIADNQRAVDRQVDSINSRIAKAAARVRPDLMESLAVISKRTYRTQSGDIDEFARDDSGQFASVDTRVRTNRGKKKETKAQERKQGIPSAKGLATATGSSKSSGKLNNRERSAYQQQFKALQNAADKTVDLGGGRIDVVLQNKESGRRRIANDVGDSLTPGGKKIDWWNPGLEDVVSIRTPNTRTGARYDVVSALGASGETSANVARGADTRNASTFAREWNDASRDQRGSSTAQTYRRIGAGAELLGSVSSDPRAQMAAEVGRWAGEFGPEAEKVFGPSMRRAAYRYRGTERDPDPGLLHDAEMRAKASHAKEVSGTGSVQSQGARLAQGPSAERKIVSARDSAMRHLARKLPSARLSELHRKSGKIPPSEGIAIDKDGNIISQSIGYAEDHYLPFNLKKMNSMKGGAYVRTRSSGGLTTEDIYAGLMSGAREVTVVSNSGQFTIDFADDFRGIRRYGDKAQQMVDRYAKTLDAIKNGQVERTPLDPAVRAEIVEQVEAEGFEGQERDEEIRSRVLTAKTDTDPTLNEIREIENKILSDLVNDPSISGDSIEREVRRRRDAELADIREQKAQRYYQLDGEGYSIALEALKEQFPYYIDDVTFANRKNAKFYGQQATDSSDPRNRNSQFRSGTDAGYVKAKYNRPDEVQEGFYDTEIEGEGKTRASQTNYQNWQHNSLNRDSQRPAPQSANDIPEERLATEYSSRRGQEAQERPNYVAQAQQATQVNQARQKAAQPFLDSLLGMSESNFNQATANPGLRSILEEASDDLEGTMNSPAKRERLMKALDDAAEGIQGYLDQDDEGAGAFLEPILRQHQDMKSQIDAATAVPDFTANENLGPAYQVGAEEPTVNAEFNRLRSVLQRQLPGAERNIKMGDVERLKSARREVDTYAEFLEAGDVTSPESQAAAVAYLKATKPGISDAAINATIHQLNIKQERRDKTLQEMQRTQETLDKMGSLFTAYNAGNDSQTGQESAQVGQVRPGATVEDLIGPQGETQPQQRREGRGNPTEAPQRGGQRQESRVQQMNRRIDSNNGIITEDQAREVAQTIQDLAGDNQELAELAANANTQSDYDELGDMAVEAARQAWQNGDPESSTQLGSWGMLLGKARVETPERAFDQAIGDTYSAVMTLDMDNPNSLDVEAQRDLDILTADLLDELNEHDGHQFDWAQAVDDFSMAAQNQDAAQKAFALSNVLDNLNQAGRSDLMVPGQILEKIVAIYQTKGGRRGA